MGELVAAAGFLAAVGLSVSLLFWALCRAK
jgi:hypothetical protein